MWRSRNVRRNQTVSRIPGNLGQREREKITKSNSLWILRSLQGPLESLQSLRGLLTSLRPRNGVLSKVFSLPHEAESSQGHSDQQRIGTVAITMSFYPGHLSAVFKFQEHDIFPLTQKCPCPYLPVVQESPELSSSWPSAKSIMSSFFI